MSRRTSRRGRGQTEVNAKIGSLLARVEELQMLSDEEFEQLLVEFDLVRHEASVRARFYDDGWIVEPDGKVIFRGRPLHLVTTVTAVRRIQHRTLTESPLQRRARLVSFQAAVASGGSGGTVGIAHLDLADGLRLVDLLGGTGGRPPVPPDWDEQAVVRR